MRNLVHRLTDWPGRTHARGRGLLPHRSDGALRRQVVPAGRALAHWLRMRMNDPCCTPRHAVALDRRGCCDHAAAAFAFAAALAALGGSTYARRRVLGWWLAGAISRLLLLAPPRPSRRLRLNTRAPPPLSAGAAAPISCGCYCLRRRPCLSLRWIRAQPPSSGGEATNTILRLLLVAPQLSAAPHTYDCLPLVPPCLPWANQ